MKRVSFDQSALLPNGAIVAHQFEQDWQLLGPTKPSHQEHMLKFPSIMHSHAHIQQQRFMDELSVFAVVSLRSNKEQLVVELTLSIGFSTGLTAGFGPTRLVLPSAVCVSFGK